MQQSMRSRVLRIVVFFFVWFLIGLIFAGQLRLMAIASGVKMDWPGIVVWELMRWSLWAFLVPLALRQIRRLPMHATSKIRFLLIHVTTSVLLSLLHLAIFTGIYWLVFKILVFKMIFSVDFHIGILVYWVILVGRQAIIGSRHAAELKAQLAESRMAALQMQLHPHFLFNTLNSISTLLHKDPPAADDMIGELGTFLRKTLQGTPRSEISLNEELSFLTSYLEIERIRFQNQLTVEMDIDPLTRDAQVPNLILQPVVENAIRHGISQRTDHGRIRVHSRKNGPQLHLQVTDNVPGIQGDLVEGIGLGNVRERLESLYGPVYSLRLSNLASGGLSVDIEIPFRLPAGTKSTNQ
jgi:sensor histidine kinase YesM